MARLHVKGLQWLEPPAAYAHGSMKESVFYGCFLVAFVETYDSQHVAPPTRRFQCASPGACHLTTWKPRDLQMLPAFQVFCICESMWVALVQQRVVNKELRR